MLSLVTAPNSILSEKAKPVVKLNKDVLKKITAMKQVLLAAKDPEGVGLAAPQIGIPLQIFIVKQSPKAAVTVYINPEIVLPKQTLQHKKAKAKKTKKLEGCLSLPNIWGEVLRYPQVSMKYMDEKGHWHTKKFTGFLATIVQHECDHLQGLLFPKHVLEQKGMLYKSHKDEKGEDVFEELTI